MSEGHFLHRDHFRTAVHHYTPIPTWSKHLNEKAKRQTIRRVATCIGNRLLLAFLTATENRSLADVAAIIEFAVTVTDRRSDGFTIKGWEMRSIPWSKLKPELALFFGRMENILHDELVDTARGEPRFAVRVIMRNESSASDEDESRSSSSDDDDDE